MAKTLMKGNEAIAEAAVRAGCRFFFGYPITPQNEIPEYMSARLPEVGGCFLQAESEVSAINMVYGAAGTGARVLTSSSSPGISLKEEGISYIAGAELPCVIINVMRGGPGLGSIQASQGDYFQATRGGGHGDYRHPVYAPASVQETVNMMGRAFEVADKYRTPVMVIVDGIIGQMMEPVELPEMTEYKVDRKEKPWAATGWKAGDEKERAVINSLYITTEELSDMNNRLLGRYAIMEETETLAESYMTDDAEFIVSGFGTIARICKSAVDELRQEGIKVGLFRPITVWPFPKKELREVALKDNVKAVLTVELNAGQMFEDVCLTINGKKPSEFLGHAGSLLPTVEEIKERIMRMREELK